MVNKIITDEEIEKITKLLYRNGNLQVIKILNTLPELKEEKKEEEK
jgi:hypothetical protein